jgi:phosphoribosylformimino-5-aminoimidazole carboxamide ribotide isomerase
MLDVSAASLASAKSALAASPKTMQLGGGVNAGNAAEWIEAGASHVIVTSFVLADGLLREDRLQELLRAVGKDHLVLDLSCRKKADGHYYVVMDRWQKFTDLRVDEASLAKLAASCDKFLVHGVDVEGTQLGIDLELVQLLGKFSPIPVTYAGGARVMDDLNLVEDAGAGRVDIAIGSALDIFGGKLKFTDVLKWHASRRVPTSRLTSRRNSQGN